jgi:aldehyde dehydrogenase (NAD+)
VTSAPTLPAGLLIGSDRITNTSGGYHAHIYPATGQPNAAVPLAGVAEIDRAVASAWDAHREWMSLTVDRRRDLLIDLADAVHENLDDLARLNVHDYAVPISFAGTALLLERFLRYYAGYVDKPHGSSTPVDWSFDVNLIEREPYGVVGVITPWNGALAVTASCVAPALAAGNAVLLKPSELAPLASLRFGELCTQVGLPAGLVNVVPAGPEGGEALVRHPGIRKIHFTGGDATARKVLQSAAVNLTPVVAELGGKSANIVFDDADGRRGDVVGPSRPTDAVGAELRVRQPGAGARIGLRRVLGEVRCRRRRLDDRRSARPCSGVRAGYQPVRG